MGGSIFIGVRYKDKGGTIKEVLMDRWTNDFPWWTNQVSFLKQGDEFYRFVEDAKPENEWPDSKKLDKIECGEYGVIFYDFITHEILSYNNYSSVNLFVVTHKDGYEAVYELINSGMIKSITQYVWENGHLELREIPEDIVLTTPCEEIGIIRVETSSDFHIEEHVNRHPDISAIREWLSKNGWNGNIDAESFNYEPVSR